MKYTFINASIDLGTHVDGTKDGPKLITNYFENYQVVDVNQDNIVKDKDTGCKFKNLKYINKFNKKLYNEVIKVIKNNGFPITVGGDHSLAIATALASNMCNKDIGIIWIDAHADYNTIKSTITGNVHGLPLAAINGHNKFRLSAFLHTKYISHAKTIIIGARSIDEKEKLNLEKDNITVYTTDDIHKYGVNEIMDKAFKQINTNKIHISYDLDSIDPKVCPGVSIPEKGGLTINEAYNIMRYIKDKNSLIKSLDLVEYNPHYDIDNKSLNIAIDLLNIFVEK